MPPGYYTLFIPGLLRKETRHLSSARRAELDRFGQACRTDNLPQQRLHPAGHWYEIPNLLRNSVLAQILPELPQLNTLIVHYIDALGANIDPAIAAITSIRKRP